MISPSKRAQPYCTPEPTLCGVCHGPAVWLGYAPLSKWLDLRGPVMWLCDSPICHAQARRVYQSDNDSVPLVDSRRGPWTGSCAWCGTHGGATDLFGFAMMAPVYYSFCDPQKTDCLDQWLAENRRKPWCSEAEAPSGREHKPWSPKAA